MTSSSQTVTAPLSFKETNASVLLDLVRGMAALMVLLMHGRNLLFLDYSALSHHNLFLLVIYVLSATGHQAVLIFFVLSGYLIGGSVFRALEHNRWSWADYLLHRFTRLWLVLIPGLLLGGMWDWIGMHHTHAASLYGGWSGDHMVANVYERLTGKIFLGNVFFLQKLYVPTFGSNEALWSLTNEFWYYMLFPLGAIALWKRTRTVPRLVCIALFLLLLWRPTFPLLPQFLIWLAGVLLTRMPALRLGNSVRIVAATIYIFFYFGLTRPRFVSDRMGDFIFSTVTFFFFWIMLSATAKARNSASVRLSRTLSSFSYTLYVAHTPLLVLITALLLGERRWTPDATHLTIATVILLGVIAYAWALATCTEIHTHHVVAWIKARARIAAA
jgi:peptidoglycan/LPS O-acetylase OafA/YrhL